MRLTCPLDKLNETYDELLGMLRQCIEITRGIPIICFNSETNTGHFSQYCCAKRYKKLFP